MIEQICLFVIAVGLLGLVIMALTGGAGDK
jgi:hypothetical protein